VEWAGLQPAQELKRGKGWLCSWPGAGGRGEKSVVRCLRKGHVYLRKGAEYWKNHDGQVWGVLLVRGIKCGFNGGASFTGEEIGQCLGGECVIDREKQGEINKTTRRRKRKIIKDRGGVLPKGGKETSTLPRKRREGTHSKTENGSSHLPTSVTKGIGEGPNIAGKKPPREGPQRKKGSKNKKKSQTGESLNTPSVHL